MPPFPQSSGPAGAPPEGMLSGEMSPAPTMSQGMDPMAPMTPEHRAELQELLAKVKQEYSKWQSMSFGVKNTANEVKRDQLKKVFQLLQEHGVDLNDPESVAKFLAEVKRTSPQHYEAITKALDYLLGNDYETQPEGAEELPAEGTQELPPEEQTPSEPAQPL